MTRQTANRPVVAEHAFVRHLHRVEGFGNVAKTVLVAADARPRLHLEPRRAPSPRPNEDTP